MYSEDNRLYSIPPYAYCNFFDKDDLLTLAKTNRFFINCLLPIASPEITIEHEELQLGPEWAKLFPKVRVTIDLSLHPTFPDNFQEMINQTSLNITSLNCPSGEWGWSCFEIGYLSHLTRLHSLSLRTSQFDKLSQNSDLYHFTQLKNLDLGYHSFLEAATLRKFTNLEHLNLECNSVIKALDLEYLHESLTSLSLANNSTLDPLVLTKLKLLSLNLESNRTVTADILTQCKTIKELYISYDTILPLRYLKALTSLEKLSIESDYSISPSIKIAQFNFAPVRFLTSLTNLVIDDNSHKINITYLSLLRSLKKLKIYPYFSSQSHLQMLEDFVLARLINLTDLTIASDKIKGDCFKYLTQLTKLKIKSKKLNSSNLKYLVKLKYLNLACGCVLQEINLMDLSCLVSLKIFCSFKVIVSGMNYCLQSLYVYGSSSEIIDDRLIEALVGLRKLVIVGGNMITIPCLLNLTALVSVSLPATNRFNQKKNKKGLAMLLKNGVTFEKLNS
ncbi:MAG: hypothetical protein Harvfovirus7_34 [Harvfovirus sp.]|uniref:Leucine-rich repeat protein n=1 Tax=Harvfovirus sp. TaxID=2487768 RepID=A0A3G5A0W3_9VIRU|nr:MAG: hypothetical protein Harvfovirus7_34 [Harvfovirus sp.]